MSTFSWRKRADEYHKSLDIYFQYNQGPDAVFYKQQGEEDEEEAKPKGRHVVCNDELTKEEKNNINTLYNDLPVVVQKYMDPHSSEIQTNKKSVALKITQEVLLQAGTELESIRNQRTYLINEKEKLKEEVKNLNAINEEQKNVFNEQRTRKDKLTKRLEDENKKLLSSLTNALAEKNELLQTCENTQKNQSTGTPQTGVPIFSKQNKSKPNKRQRDNNKKKQQQRQQNNETPSQSVEKSDDEINDVVSNLANLSISSNDQSMPDSSMQNLKEPLKIVQAKERGNANNENGSTKKPHADNSGTPKKPEMGQTVVLSGREVTKISRVASQSDLVLGDLDELPDEDDLPQETVQGAEQAKGKHHNTHGKDHADKRKQVEKESKISTRETKKPKHTPNKSKKLVEEKEDTRQQDDKTPLQLYFSTENEEIVKARVVKDMAKNKAGIMDNETVDYIAFKMRLNQLPVGFLEPNECDYQVRYVPTFSKGDDIGHWVAMIRKNKHVYVFEGSLSEHVNVSLMLDEYKRQARIIWPECTAISVVKPKDKWRGQDHTCGYYALAIVFAYHNQLFSGQKISYDSAPKPIRTLPSHLFRWVKNDKPLDELKLFHTH